MRQFLSFFRQFLKPLANSNICIFVNIALKLNCDILKSKLMLCEWNASYFIEIAFIGFTLHQIKQCIVFFGTPGTYIYSGCQKNESSLIFVMKLEIRLHPEFLSTQTCTFGPQICTLGSQTCTLCFTIASDIFASTFLPN